MTDTPEVTIAEATGFAGSGIGPLGPQIEQAMHQAAANCAAEGIMDDTPNAVLAEKIGPKAMKELFGDEADTATGTHYIRAAKMAARKDMREKHREAIAEHERQRAEALAAQAAAPAASDEAPAATE